VSQEYEDTQLERGLGGFEASMEQLDDLTDSTSLSRPPASVRLEEAIATPPQLQLPPATENSVSKNHPTRSADLLSHMSNMNQLVAKRLHCLP
jgi:hypothetical protein